MAKKHTHKQLSPKAPEKPFNLFDSNNYYGLNLSEDTSEDEAAIKTYSTTSSTQSPSDDSDFADRRSIRSEKTHDSSLDMFDSEDIIDLLKASHEKSEFSKNSSDLYESSKSASSRSSSVSSNDSSDQKPIRRNAQIAIPGRTHRMQLRRSTMVKALKSRQNAALRPRRRQKRVVAKKAPVNRSRSSSVPSLGSRSRSSSDSERRVRFKSTPLIPSSRSQLKSQSYTSVSPVSRKHLVDPRNKDVVVEVGDETAPSIDLCLTLEIKVDADKHVVVIPMNVHTHGSGSCEVISSKFIK